MVICFYSLTKRFTDYTHVFLGISLALAPVGAWLAVRGAQITPLEIVQMLTLAVSVVLWLVGFDIIYALQDYEFDRTHGLRSLVVAWGPKNALQAAFLAHMLMCGTLLAFGLLSFGLRPIAYIIGWLIILLLPRAGTLDCAAAQSELDQHRFLPAERRGERGILCGDIGGSDFPRR